MYKRQGPDTFTQKKSVMFVTMMLFGGTGSILGPIFGAVFVPVSYTHLEAFEKRDEIVVEASVRVHIQNAKKEAFEFYA